MYKRARLGIGYLSQEPSIFQRLSVRENLYAILETMAITTAERNRRAERLIERFGLAEVADRNGDKPFSNFAMVRVASYIVLEYWRQEKRQLTWLSLNDETEDGEGDTIELWETLADDKAVDLDAWLDAEKWRLGCPRRLVRIARKKVWGIPLNETERRYFNRARRKELAKRQKTLL
ncbi:hypothetical protein ES703_66625 [subsurface metagenome]